MLNFNKKKYVSFDNLKSFNGLLQSSLKEKLDGYKSETDTKVQKKFNELSGKVQTDSEVIDARKGEASLRAKIDVIDEDIKNVSSQLSHIAYSIYNEEGTITDKINKSIEKGSVILPPGEFKIDSSIIMKNGCKLIGSGIDRTVLVVENTKTIDGVFLVDSINDCYISDLTIKSIDNKNSVGIKILNNSNNNKIDRVKIEGFGSGIIIEGQNYEVKNTTIRDCVCTNVTYPSGGTYGISTANSDNTVIENCITTYNWLDGLKLRQKANNTKIIGGVSSYNGISAIGNKSNNGNGVDCFRGGQNILIKDLICEHNKGVGIYIKNDKENIEGKYEPLKDIQIINCTSRFNDFAGLMVNRITSDTDPTAPLVNNILISGGIYSNNNNSGIYIRARNVSINNTLTENNKEYGIYIISSNDVKCSNNQLLGNGLKSTGVYAGIRVDLSKRVNMNNNTIIGVSPSSSNGDYSELTSITKTGAFIGTGCDDIYINNINVYKCTNTNFKVQVTTTEGTCIINHGVITSNVAFGSPGSTFIYNGKLYVKSSGTPNSWVVGEWESIVG